MSLETHAWTKTADGECICTVTDEPADLCPHCRVELSRLRERRIAELEAQLAASHKAGKHMEANRDKCVALLEAEIERLNAELASSKYAEASGAACGYCSHAGSIQLAEIERLKALLHSLDDDWARQCMAETREANKYRLIIHKLGRRLGCLKKRRRKELAEFEDILGRHKLSEHALTALLEKRIAQAEQLKTKTERLEQLIADAYDNGVLDSRHAHAAIAAHATRKRVHDDG